MKRILWIVPLIAMAMCTIASAEPRGLFVRTAAQTVTTQTITPEVMPVGFFHHHGGGGPSCGAEPSCGAAPTCGAEPSCGCGEDVWSDYCCPKRCKRHCGLLHHHKHRCCSTVAGCGCDMAAPSCGCEMAAPSCGCDAPVACNSCGGRHGLFGHHGCGCGGCCYRPCCGKFRHWSNGWCGQMIDGYSCGNPPACMGDAAVDVEGGKSIPTPAPMAEPMGDVTAPAKSTRRPVLAPRFSANPVGLGLQ